MHSSHRYPLASFHDHDIYICIHPRSLPEEYRSLARDKMSETRRAQQLAKAQCHLDGRGRPKPSVAAAALLKQEASAVIPFTATLTARPPAQRANLPHAQSRPAFDDQRACAFEEDPPPPALALQ